MDRRYLTTTQAAKLLSVSPDTVLKWVRAGKIESYRTPGGHCRIPAEAIQTMLPTREEAAPASDNAPQPFKYCWEFHSPSGEICSECGACVVYQSRAKRCYELRDLPEQFGHLKLHCDTTCDECEYYNVVKGQGLNVLVVTKSSALVRRMAQDNDGDEFHLKFATSEYEAAALIEGFRPDFILIDASMGVRQTKQLCVHLKRDPRVPFIRIVLASSDGRIPESCNHDILGWIKKPFSTFQLRDFIATMQEPKRE